MRNREMRSKFKVKGKKDAQGQKWLSDICWGQNSKTQTIVFDGLGCQRYI